MQKKALAKNPKKISSGRKLKKAVLAGGVLLLLILGLFWGAYINNQGGIGIIINNQQFLVEVADDPNERAQGLSGRNILDTNQGMWFIYGEPDYHGIWMRDMRLAIDVIWVGSDYKIIDIASNLQPSSYPKIYKPARPALYVLELPAGSIARYNLGIDDLVKL